jgi:superfamily II DNA or RNA helicase
MITLHLEKPSGGPCAFFADAPADALADAVASVVWFPEELEATARCIVPSLRNLLMFLSDVRGRKFKRGIFLGDDVLALAEAFRHAARGVAEGRVVPDAELCDGGFRAVWRPVGDADPFLTDAFMRSAGLSPLEAMREKTETIHDAWLAALRRSDGFVAWPSSSEAEAFVRRMAEWLSPISLTPEERASLKFTLAPPPSADGEWRILCSPPATRAGLTALGQAAMVFPPIGALSGGAAPLTPESVEAFVRAGAANLAAAGVAVELPEGLVGEHISAEAEVFSPEAPAGQSDKPPPGGIAARLKVRIDGVEVDERTIEFLLDQHTPFVYFNEHWIEVDRFALQDALKALRAANGRRLSMREAISFSFGMQRAGRLRIEKVKAHGWLRGLLNELRGADRFHELPPPKGLAGELRDYQSRGVAWMTFLVRWGFGPLLADDMGLGKTIQTIAWMLHFKRGHVNARVLVVAPVSVTTNWTREIARFAPGLSVYLHQGGDRAAGMTFQRRVRAADVTVAGYALFVRDFREFAAAGFDALVLDEAQTIKNPETRAAKAARALGAGVRIALTGTPFENSAGDLWSLQEFLNPGLLGSRRDFTERFARPIAEDAHSGAASRLKHVLEPFILRRLKTDPGVAAELGEKREVREYCPLSQDQRRRYEEALAAYRRDQAADAGDGSRSGRVLALLTELKLVCDGEGKFARLVDLLEGIFEAGESALVFTQYAKAGREIRDRLEDEFGRRFPFLHGSLSAEEREREIGDFNADPEPNAFILSLRAGGFGLNLTRATHVIHFDRWWNPAVENQATDRAHRIGQTKTVFVHLFIAPGTLEDHIDELLESKRRIAGEVVGSGESFLMKMSDDELDKVVSLDA